MFTARFFHILFWLCILVEPLLLTVWAGKTGLYLSPVLWLVVALVPACLLLFAPRRSRSDALFVPFIDSHNTVWTIFCLGMLACAITLATRIGQYEVSPLNSDILPSLKLYATRFLAGTDPYAPMEFPGWTVMPNYFTLRWLPFIPAEQFKFDYRWIGFIALSATFWYHTRRMTTANISKPQLLLAVAAPWLMLFLFMHFDRYAFGNAVETLIAAYYLALAFSLFRSPAAMAFGIVLCLMSRISFTFWLPAYGVMILMQYGIPTAIRTGLYVFGAVFLLFVAPYVLPDSGKMFMDGLKYYELCATAEWYRQGWQESGAIPTHLGRGIGFAYYWYKEGAEAVQYAACQRAFQLISLAMAALLLGGYLIARKKNYPMQAYGVVSLKIYLSVFYAFIPIPYHYLYLTPCLLSVALIGVWVNSRQSTAVSR
jgi:hypothetical protein